MAGSFVVSKTVSFEVQLLFRYLLPPILTNVYLFGFTEMLARKVNSSQWRFFAKQAAAKVE